MSCHNKTASKEDTLRRNMKLISNYTIKFFIDKLKLNTVHHTSTNGSIPPEISSWCDNEDDNWNKYYLWDIFSQISGARSYRPSSPGHQNVTCRLSHTQRLIIMILLLAPIPPARGILYK